LLSLKTNVKVPWACKKLKNLGRQNLLSVSILKVTEEKSGSESVIQWYGSADPDPYKNVTVPERWLKGRSSSE